LPIGFLTLAGFLALADAEGVWSDPNGHLNNPFTLACSSGVLADRTIVIGQDGEYNWMFAKGQNLNITINSLDSVSSFHIILFSWHSARVFQDTVLSSGQSLEWNLLLPDSGRWQLEILNLSGLGNSLQIHVVAGYSGNLGLLNCVNPGDLFKSDNGD